MAYTIEDLKQIIQGDREFPDLHTIGVSEFGSIRPSIGMTYNFDTDVTDDEIISGARFILELQKQEVTAQPIAAYAEQLSAFDTKVDFYEHINKIAVENGLIASDILGFDVDKRIAGEQKIAQIKLKRPENAADKQPAPNDDLSTIIKGTTDENVNEVITRAAQLINKMPEEGRDQIIQASATLIADRINHSNTIEQVIEAINQEIHNSQKFEQIFSGDAQKEEDDKKPAFSIGELQLMIKGDKEFSQSVYVEYGDRDTKVDSNATYHGAYFLEGLQELGVETETIQTYAKQLRDVKTKVDFYEQIQHIAGEINIVGEEKANASDILGFDVDKRITEERQKVKQREEIFSGRPNIDWEQELNSLEPQRVWETETNRLNSGMIPTIKEPISAQEKAEIRDALTNTNSRLIQAYLEKHPINEAKDVAANTIDLDSEVKAPNTGDGLQTEVDPSKDEVAKSPKQTQAKEHGKG